jgi:agmatine/peptidylarginine deiminase
MTTIYFSSLLKQKRYLPFYNRLVKLFKNNNLSCKFVEGTKDIWMRDFMPVKSMDGKYIQFDYHPIYLKKYPKYITDGSLIAKQLGIEIIKTDIKLDGGNFVCYNGKAIITSRIFKENPQYKEENLIDKVKDLLKLNKIIIIEEEYDTYGHSDGMVRFVDDNTVLINEYPKKHIKYKKKLTDVLEKEGLKYIEIPSTDNMTKAIGLYINYLQFENIIVLPAFNIDNDKKTLKMFKEIFKEYKILQLDCTEIAKAGGVLNCISWNL